MARIGKYVVTAELGRGERCVVWSALDPGIGRPVAIKRLDKKALALPDEQAKQVLGRFRRQAQAAGMLHHPNVIAIYEYEENAEQAWIAMEIVHGKSLRAHLEAGYKPGADELPDLVVQLLEALDFSHGHGVMHGDVRAENVLVSQNGSPKLGNFGGRPADEAGDVAAAAKLIGEILPAAADVLQKQHEGARALLEALRAAFRPKTVATNVAALRRAVKEAPKTVARKLPSVLFVDDEERVTNALRSLFDGVYDIATASSGAQALELLKSRRFHVVVSDQRMPGMTGVEMLREARAAVPNTVRLLLTGYSDLSAIVGSVNESEVFRFVSKPWDQEDLQATLAEAVNVAIAVEAAAAGGRRATASNAAVLVVGEQELARGLRELGAKILEAANEAAALEVLAKEEVGVVICDQDNGALLRALKQQAPTTQLVVVSAASDANMTIGLINEARIFRLLVKPVNLSLLHQAVGAALERHARLAATPSLAATESAKASEGGQVRSLLDRIRALGGRFARGSAAS